MQHIEYAKSKSYATLRHEDPDFVPPTSVHVKNAPNGARLLANGAGEKRPRGDERMDEDARDVKRERTARDADDSDDEEMEIEDDDEQQQTSGKGQAANGAQRVLSCLNRSRVAAHTTPYSVRCRPNTCSNPAVVGEVNVPQSATRGHRRRIVRPLPTVRKNGHGIRPSVLTYRARYQGFHSVSVVPSPTPNAQGQKVKIAYVMFDSPDLASVAKEALDGFTLKKGWVMSVSYI